MLIYWLLLAFPALQATFYPVRAERRGASLGQQLALAALVVGYTLLALLRYRIGADWENYEDMYVSASYAPLSESMSITDPLFSLILWFSALMGAGIYVANAVAAFLLCYGVVRIAGSMREPWLTATAAVPYILIVVGLGYVRQAAAIGLVLLAVNSLQRGRPFITMFQLVCAVGFHSSAIVMLPMFGLAIANRNRLRLLLLGLIGGMAVIGVLIENFSRLDTGYLQAEYQSGGALVRLMLNVLCSLLLLVRWRHLGGPERTRSFWLGVALANMGAAAAFVLTPSSTAVDRISLHFSIIQLYVFGNISELIGANQKASLLLRMLVIGVAVAVQVVWLFFATHASFWVPYQSILGFY